MCVGDLLHGVVHDLARDVEVFCFKILSADDSFFIEPVGGGVLL